MKTKRLEMFDIENVKEYAGIGARKTPPDVLELMQNIAFYFAKQNKHLRTGNAEGADYAFMKGVNQCTGYEVSLYLPWPTYRKDYIQSTNGICVQEPSKEAIHFAGFYHTAWEKCGENARKFHGRNAQIIMGSMLVDPVDIVICYSESDIKGGTAMGIQIAKAHQIPVYNLYYEPIRAFFRGWMLGVDKQWQK